MRAVPVFKGLSCVSTCVVPSGKTVMQLPQDKRSGTLSESSENRRKQFGVVYKASLSGLMLPRSLDWHTFSSSHKRP